MTRRIVISGIKKSEISTEDLANIFYLQAKRRLAERRECEAKAKAKRAQREQRKDKDSGGRS
ncbi:MAG: hypothetical protein WB998_12810 [Solirubrobacteraceae bacterium]